MPQKISTPKPITTVELATINTNVAANELILDNAAVPLSETQLKSILNVSIVRSAEITDVNLNIIEPFPQTVPASIVLVDFEANLTYIENLKKTQAVMVVQAGKMQTLIGIAENNAMVDVNLILNNSRLLAGNNKDIKEAVAKLSAKYFTKAPVTKATGFIINQGGIITISSVQTGKKFINTGDTILSFLVVGGTSTLTIKVNPSTSAMVPKGWTNIVVTNLSAIEAGSFEVFIG